MKNAAFATWLALRAARWLLYIGFLAYGYAFVLDRSSYINSFGNLLRSTEAWMFGLGVGAVYVGMLELMMREKAGIARPNYFRLLPPRKSP